MVVSADAAIFKKEFGGQLDPLKKSVDAFNIGESPINSELTKTLPKKDENKMPFKDLEPFKSPNDKLYSTLSS